MLTERQLLWLGEDIDVQSFFEREKRLNVYSLSYERLSCYRSIELSRPIVSGSSFLRRKKNEEEKKKEDYSYFSFFKRKKNKSNCEYFFSASSKNKVREKIFALFSAYKKLGREGDFSFVTLTFVSKVDDLKAVKLLNVFLNQIRKLSRKKDINYIWVAERQGNGNIHFHLIFDRSFYGCRDQLSLDFLNSHWVSVQEKSGVVNLGARKKLIRDLNFSRFSHLHDQKKYDLVKKYLNPITILKVKDVDGLSFYLTKYLTKNNSGFKCRPWHCSRGVSRIFTKQIVFEPAKNDAFNPNKNRSKNGKVPSSFLNDFCLIIKIYNKAFFQKNHLELLDFVNACVVEMGDDFFEKIKYIYYSDADFFRESVKDSVRLFF